MRPSSRHSEWIDGERVISWPPHLHRAVRKGRSCAPSSKLQGWKLDPELSHCLASWGDKRGDRSADATGRCRQDSDTCVRLCLQGRGTVITGRVEQGIVKVGDDIELVGINGTPTKTVVTGEALSRLTVLRVHCFLLFVASHREPRVVMTHIL